MPQTRCWATAAAGVVSIGLPGVSAAATLNVPADYPTIQACIDAAVSGFDECVAAPGTYHETINFLGKAITLRSSAGPAVTTIDATGLNSSVVKCISGEGPDTVLDGFTITGGRGAYAPSINSYAGGGMYNLYSSPTVTNCTFNNNYVGSFSTPYRAALGGGMCNLYSSPTVTHCTFNNNAAFPSPVDHPGLGGGMYNYYSSTTVTHCEFNGNSAVVGGGMVNDRSNPTVTNCTLRGNRAVSGGGMENYVSSPIVSNSTFSGNTAFDAGGGMVNGGGTPTVTDCTFSGNTAFDEGGGMVNDRSNPTVTNCTFSGNTATYLGSGILNENSNPTVTNCILWGDSSDEIVNNSSTSTIRFSDVQDGLPVGAVDGGGNINLDPMFVRPPDPGLDGTWDGVDDDYGDLRLRGGSPCINRGDPGFVGQPGETDIEGHARVLCGRVDMGAYEFGIGDYDCDQVVDLADFSSWQACMTGPSTADTAVPHAPGCEGFDFDGDADVDLLDFGGFQRIVGP